MLNIFNLNKELRHNLRTINFHKKRDDNMKEKQVLHLRDKRVSLLFKKRKRFKNDNNEYEENNSCISHNNSIEDLFKQLTSYYSKDHLINVVKNIKLITDNERSLIYLLIF
jgi:hypothetical protein